MTLEELKQKTKHELMGELVSDLKEGRETELTSLLKEYLRKNYYLVNKEKAIDFDKYKYSSITIILNAVAENYGVKPEQIMSSSRKAPLPDARHVYFYVAKQVANSSLPLTLLAQHINRDHSTAVHGVKKITGFIETDKILQARITDIIGECKFNLEKIR